MLVSVTPGQCPTEQGDSRTQGTTTVERAHDTLIVGRGCPRHTVFALVKVGFGAAS